MHLLVILTAVLLTGCGSSNKPVDPPKPDPAKESWYAPSIEQLQKLYQEAESLLKRGQSDEAAALITESQPLISRVLGVPKPTLSAMEVASDLDDLYGRMLLTNRHYGSARLMFQKNVARWKHWRPQTEETARRRKLAESRVAECDRHID